jgi:hypothetical protein
VDRHRRLVGRDDRPVGRRHGGTDTQLAAIEHALRAAELERKHQTGAEAFIRSNGRSSAGSTRSPGSAPSAARPWRWSATATG